MTEYRCRWCGWFLFSSDLPEGQIRGVLCPNRRCDKRQTVYLGQPQRTADVPAVRPAVLTARARA